MKHKVAVALCALALILVAGGSVWAFSAKPSKMCRYKGVHHQVAISGGRVSPQRTEGKLCDTLTITNQDPISREVAFGPHDNHVPYDGVAERILGQGQSFTLTLNKAGSYRFHDHLHDETQGSFTVLADN